MFPHNLKQRIRHALDCSRQDFCTRSKAPLGLFCSRLTWGQGGAEPAVVDSAARPEVVAVRCPAVERGEAPTAPAKHAVRAQDRCGTTRVSLSTARIVFIPVPAQF